jgi:hypothetical protein
MYYENMSKNIYLSRHRFFCSYHLSLNKFSMLKKILCTKTCVCFQDLHISYWFPKKDRKFLEIKKITTVNGNVGLNTKLTAFNEDGMRTDLTSWSPSELKPKPTVLFPCSIVNAKEICIKESFFFVVYDIKKQKYWMKSRSLMASDGESLRETINWLVNNIACAYSSQYNLWLTRQKIKLKKNYSVMKYVYITAY